jgi:radical S-adenosyl methionine domain-containing protein 2
VAGEHDSKERLRVEHDFTVTDEEYESFCSRHKHQTSFVAGPDYLMTKSYLILDECMRFFDRHGRQPSKPILEVGVLEALKSIFWDE